MPKTRSNTLTWNSRGANDSFLEGKQNKSISKGQQPFAIMMILGFLKGTHQSSYVFPTEKKNNTIIVSPQNGKSFLLPCITVLYCTDVYIIISFTWNIHPASRGVAAHTAGLFRSVRGAKGGFPPWGLPKLRIFTFPPVGAPQAREFSLFPPWGLPKLGNFHFSPPWGLPKLGNFHFSPPWGLPKLGNFHFSLPWRLSKLRNFK